MDSDAYPILLLCQAGCSLFIGISTRWYYSRICSKHLRGGPTRHCVPKISCPRVFPLRGNIVGMRVTRGDRCTRRVTINKQLRYRRWGGGIWFVGGGGRGFRGDESEMEEMLEIDANTTWNCCAEVDKDNQVEEKWRGEILARRAATVATCDIIMVGEWGLGDAEVVMWAELRSSGFEWEEWVGFSYVDAPYDIGWQRRQ